MRRSEANRTEVVTDSATTGFACNGSQWIFRTLYACLHHSGLHVQRTVQET
eukprot:SAG31_NODE_35460_length_323_cov_0.602679_1_plen_50_part_10